MNQHQRTFHCPELISEQRPEGAIRQNRVKNPDADRANDQFQQRYTPFSEPSAC